MAQEAVYVCLRVLKESNKRSFDSYNVRNRVLIISYIIFRDCRVPIFADNLARNSCIWRKFGLVRRVTLPSQIRDQLGEPFFLTKDSLIRNKFSPHKRVGFYWFRPSSTFLHQAQVDFLTCRGVR